MQKPKYNTTKAPPGLGLFNGQEESIFTLFEDLKNIRVSAVDQHSLLYEQGSKGSIPLPGPKESYIMYMRNIDDVISWLESFGRLNLDTTNQVTILKNIRESIPKPTRSFEIIDCKDRSGHKAHIFDGKYCEGHAFDHT